MNSPQESTSTERAHEQNKNVNIEIFLLRTRAKLKACIPTISVMTPGAALLLVTSIHIWNEIKTESTNNSVDLYEPLLFALLCVVITVLPAIILNKSDQEIRVWSNKITEQKTSKKINDILK